MYHENSYRWLKSLLEEHVKDMHVGQARSRYKKPRELIGVTKESVDTVNIG